MDQSNPQIGFTFPLRWLDDPEDRKFLKENLISLSKKGNLQQVLHPKLTKGFVSNYSVVLKTYAYQPVKINLTQAQINSIFKEAFGGARCAQFESLFVQTERSSSLPMLEMEIYF